MKKSLNVAETPGGNVGNESFRSSHVCSSTRTHMVNRRIIQQECNDAESEKTNRRDA